MPRQEEVVVLGLERGHGRGGGWRTARSAGQAAAKGIDGFGRPRPLVSLVSSGGSGVDMLAQIPWPAGCAQ